MWKHKTFKVEKEYHQRNLHICGLKMDTFMPLKMSPLYIYTSRKPVRCTEKLLKMKSKELLVEI